MPYNSTITKKHCKCSPDCKLWPSLSFGGYHFNHAPQGIKDKVGSKKEAQRKVANARKSVSVKLRGINNSEKVEMDFFFRTMRQYMKGVCANCGGETCRYHEKYYKFSLCHLLPKKIFKSIATNKNNIIELCFFGNSCHSNFDNGMLEMDKMKCWNEIVRKFHILYPLIAEDEKRFIPQVLLNTL